MNSWLIGLGISGAVSLGLALFAKFCPKAKISGWLSPKCELAGRMVSRFLILRIGAGAAQRVEEGVIVTLAHCIGNGVDAFLVGLLEDNKGRQK